jgi:RecB family exonuclease
MLPLGCDIYVEAQVRGRFRRWSTLLLHPLRTLSAVTIIALTPTQQRALDELRGAGADRPVFPADLAARLRERLEEGLADVSSRLAGLAEAAALAGRSGEGELVVTKRHLAAVHQCERMHMAEVGAFEWSPLTARGSVVHKALELSMGMAAPPGPGELVEMAIDRLAEQERGVAAFLAVAGPVEQAELRVAATDMLSKFADEFPPLKKAWRPRIESSLIAPLCEGRVLLKGKVDLALGRAEGTTAGVLIVDFKTGRPVPAHVDDLRFYALLETLRVGVPPFRVASWYLDSGHCHAEDVTEELLLAAARRTVDGVRSLVELRVEGRQPTWRPCPACSYCPVRAECEGALTWDELRAQGGFDV